MGFKAAVLKFKSIVLFKLGFSHKVVFVRCSDIVFYYKRKQQFMLESRDVLWLKSFLFSFKMLKKIDAYKKKGIYIKGEQFVFKLSSKKSKF